MQSRSNSWGFSFVCFFIFFQIALQFEVFLLSFSLKDLVLTPNLAELLSSLFISEIHTEANISKSWDLGNLFHDSCC